MGIARRIGYGLAGTGVLGAGVAAKRLLALDRQRGAYRRAWEAHSLATLEWMRRCEEETGERPFLYVALGDSSVQGIGASRVEDGYPARLASAIATASGAPIALLNISLSGATTESVEIGQIPLMRGLGLLDAGREPDLVTLSIGGNDVMAPHITPEAYSASIGRILEALPGRLLVSTIPSFAPMSRESRARDMSGLLAERIRARGAGLVDLRALTRSWPLATYAFGYHAADMFHPNSRAYAAWAREFSEVLSKDVGLASLDAASAPRWAMRTLGVAESGA